MPRKPGIEHGIIFCTICNTDTDHAHWYAGKGARGKYWSCTICHARRNREWRARKRNGETKPRVKKTPTFEKVFIPLPEPEPEPEGRDFLDVIASQLAKEHERDGIVIPPIRDRKDWRDPTLYKNGILNRSNISFEEVWDRILYREGEEFFTSGYKKLPFTYTVKHGGVVTSRNKFWIAPSQFRLAFERMPTGKSSDLSDLWGATTMFAIMMDKRIRETDW